MINRKNVRDVISKNEELLPQVHNYVEKIQNLGVAFRYTPIDAIKNYLAKHTNLIMFPSDELEYGGLVTYRDGRFYIHINTRQPKTYENFIWAHEFYHFYFEAELIKSSKINTFVDGRVPNESERLANLFASELLINSILLKSLYKDLLQHYQYDRLENHVIRLIEVFKLPYKCIVIKLAQDGLITVDDAVAIIDYKYQENLPTYFDQSILQPSNSIQFDSVGVLLEDATVKKNIRASDYESINTLYSTHMSNFKMLRHKEE
ncbi:ImmA/IrrE family metallo-endopeptidase [Caryophanon latum]|uniref:IrrE N-terminal-like domain-containing protein n=1 Tax=Caryophanon latum TaxID=33977 RepID=A0A1C0YUD9_9BACL|nr:ImmA/IrrE family metallo-endopeptidase [Caryophanon latum]OCS90798.1 hypothetical protein A6K76_01745 [Caryophanon latum]